jgi:plastocyanin
MPGASAATVVNLEAGDYVVIDVIAGPDGIPHAAKGLVKPFSVTAASGETAQAPQADMTVELVDYQFKVSDQTVMPGEHTVKVLNTGTEPHELSLIELAPGATVQDFLAALAPDAPPGPPPGTPVGGIGAIATDSEAYFTANLEAGKHYGLVCFIPSPKAQGTPHFMMGMVAELAVEG